MTSNRIPRLVSTMALAASLGLTGSAATAAVVNYNGSLDDSSNPALIGSGAWSGINPPAADFTDAGATANNVALYTLSVSVGGTVTFASTGFAAGGVDPYFTLFGGVGPGATMIDSNYTQAFLGGGGDFSLTEVLAMGDYTIAIGNFANMSFAENQGIGTLGDGFIGIGDPNSFHNGSYALTVTLPDTDGPGGNTIPEPNAAALALSALAAAVWVGSKRLAR